MRDAPYFPLFVDLHGKRVLVAGGGRIALRRVRTLLPFGPEITVVAPRIDPEAEALPVKKKLRPFEAADVEGCALALAATNDRAVNAAVAEAARARGIPVNVCDDPAACDFYFPGIARKGPLVLGVTASGTDHAAAKALSAAARELLERF